MELYLQSLFGLHVHSCTHQLKSCNPPSPRILAHIRGRSWSMVSQDRHLFVTPGYQRKDLKYAKKNPYLKNLKYLFFFLKVWWQYATLFVYFSYFLTYILSSNHIHTIHSPRPLHLLIACKLSGTDLPVVPSRESNSGLPSSKPTRYQLCNAAPQYLLKKFAVLCQQFRTVCFWQ